MIYRKLRNLQIDVGMYAPYETQPHELSFAFLSAPWQMTLESQGQRQQKLIPVGWC
jgi:hypothetical protein